MPFVSGFLRMRSGGSGGEIDNSLPGQQPGIDNSLPGMQPGIDNELPTPPPGVFPPPTISNPIVPIPPGTSVPPGTIWPSPNPPRPDQGLPRPPVSGQPPRPDQGLPQPPPTATHPIVSSTYWMLVYTPGHGWKYVSVDPSLSVDNTLPAQPPPVATPHK